MEQLELLTTHVPGLDTVLGGGLPPNSLVFVVGPPGAGKTVLASQILFEAARRGQRALILSNFSEGHEKLAEHLRTFAFFDEQLLAERFTLLSLLAVIGEERETAATLITRAIRDVGAKLVLIDGFQGLTGLFGRNELRRMMATLSTVTSYLGVTLIVTLEGVGRDPATVSEITTADVVIDLDYGVEGWRHRRRLDIIKQRGMPLLAGLHPYAITGAGIVVSPRLEARSAPATRPAPGRAAFDLAELDRLLGGGLPTGSMTVLSGAPGIGKTLLGLAWAWAGVQAGESGVFFGFTEQPAHLRAKAAAFGMDLTGAVEAGTLRLIRLSPVEVEPDQVADQVLAALTPATRRLVIDDIVTLILELGPRARNYLASLRDQLAGRGVTGLYLQEIAPFTGFRLELGSTPLTLIADNVLLAQQQMVADRVHRVMAVLKMRGSGYDHTLRELLLDGGSIHVLAAAESVTGRSKEIARGDGEVP